MSAAEIVIPEARAEVLALREKPEHMIRRAMEAGEALKAAVEKNGWSINLGGRHPHIMYEGAGFLGSLYHICARVVPGSTQYLEMGNAHGFQAEAETVAWDSGAPLTRASAMCMSDEENWSMRQKYEGRGAERRKATDAAGNLIMVPVPLNHLRSMAETRACSKAFRLFFSWIYTANGFAATGAEEMDEQSTGRAIRHPQSRATPGNVITELQRKRMFAIGFDKKKGTDEIIAVIRHFGFESANDITRDKYDEIVAELQKSDATE